ncbi:hypothetical protein [Riemerella anatipestifer]|uniref:Uncharacterized protein n=3 Tax=Riemerella anatipestifer TaxID=34085 RepID=A0A1S7DU79_RIEAN|nr:hypothetical protein [Riemerella anatipestifer]AQY22670.1 hypothetical protein AB406_1727 [Riemerella anatipestifer]MDR7797634.1 hypothetical protein [Riemerella anatipestifer]MDY3434020.1 hypothetical protein [Riemerella anatipestifer]MDY3440768.1 hypothetical protein [Riemerella anatipestifer]MDY3445336.1 hypothetical protein [Riemerella anatipestifer]
MSNCFNDTPHENIENCPNEDIFAGLTTRLYYVPTAFVKSFAKPVPGADYASRIKIGTGGIVLNTGKAWKFIDIQIDENELKMNLTGNVGNKKTKTEIDFLIPGFKTKTLGFIDTYKNTPCIFAIKDAEGKLFVVGSKDLGAYIESADATSGKKIDDNSGVTAKVVANSKLYYYEGEISLEAAA